MGPAFTPILAQAASSAPAAGGSVPPFPKIEFGPAAAEVLLPSAVILILLIVLNKRIVERLVHARAMTATMHSSDTILAFASAGIMGIFQLWSADSWNGQRPPPVHALMVVVTLATVVLSSKWLVHRAAAAEREQIRDLKREAKQLEEDRNWLLSTTDRIDEILEEKFRRLRSLLKGQGQPAGQVLTAETVKEQMIVIVHSIHSFFQERLHFGETLRLGLYVLDETTKTSLVAAHTWDGQDDKCFSPGSAQMLKLFRPEGMVSFIVKSYMGKESLSIIPDTSLPGVDFEFFSPEQKTRIRSVLCFRFVVPAPVEDEVWVIYMDSNRAGFFETSKTAAYKSFLDQASKRIAFEAATLQLIEPK